jgi:PAS domain S-box-containing protein
MDPLPGSRVLSLLTFAFGAYALLVGIGTLIGWFKGIPWLTDWDRDGIAMFANTAVMGCTGGAALLLREWRKPGIAISRLLGLFLALFGAACLFQHLAGVDLRIDHILIEPQWGFRAATSPGRPGVPAASAFTMIGIMLILLGGGRVARGIVPVLAIATAGISSLSLMGYVFGADPLFAVARFTGVAMQTSTVTLALAIGGMASVPERQPMRALLENSAAGALARRALPFIIGLPVIIGWLRVEAHRAGWLDTSMGAALMVLALIFLQCALLWWCVGLVSNREHSLRLKEQSLVQEVAERRRTEEALVHSEAMLRSITDHSEDVIFVKDRDSRTLFINPAGVRMSGLPLERLINHTDAEIYPQYPEQAAAFMAADKRVMESRVPETIEEEARTAEGRKFILLTTKTPRLDGDGNVIGVIGISRDITERKRAEEELRRSAEQAQQASRAKDDFLASLSHELRTPLTPALLTLVSLEDDPEFPEAFRDDLAVIRRNIQLEARLIDDLLDLTRVSRGKLLLHPEITNVHELLRHTQETIREDVRGKSLQMRVELAARENHVSADPARLQQVLWNLLKNAVKFTPTGGSVTIRTSNPAPGRFSLQVEDSGIGIPADKLEPIFLAFNQGDLTGRHQFGGLGLGLSISKAIMDAHAGAIRAESGGPGQGASFTIELSTVSPPIPVLAPPKQPPARSRKSLRLLLVEDDSATLSALSQLLERDGHSVFPASSAEQALHQAANHACDLIISDLGLPDSDGYALMAQIRDRYGWPGVALSGYGMDADLRQSSAAGFAAHLVKPVEASRLREVIESVVDGKKSHPAETECQRR